MTPQRIQMSRSHPWRAEHPDAVIVDRRTKWGNIFRIGETGWIPVDASGRWSKEPHPPLTREQAVQCFRYCAEFTAREWPGFYDALRGLDLACWCKTDEHCHADVLLDIANRRTP